MTTAELIKKREEEKNLQATQPSFSSMVVKPDPTNVTIPVDNSVNREYARNTAQEKSVNRQIEAGNAPETSDAALDALKKAPELERVSLYEVGKANASTGIADAENSVKNPSPINTKEMEDFRNQVIGVRDFGLETPEQAAARERRDYIKQGLTGLTEGLSSLANLYYTTKWAPNQKMVSQMPALQQRLYRERLERDKKLENFRAWQRAKADKKEERAYQEALFGKKQEAKAKMDAQDAEIKYLRDLGLIDARKAADLEKQKGKADLDKELEGIRQKNRVALASMNNKAAMDRVNAGRAGGANATIRVPIGGDGEYAEYRKNDLTNPIVISQIYNSLPDEYRVKGKDKVWNSETKSMEHPYDENPSTQKMQEAIGKALSDGYLTEMAPEIQVGGDKKKTGKKSIDGFSGEKQNSNKKTISGF